MAKKIKLWKKEWEKNWKFYLLKFAFFICGFYLFTLGIAVTSPTDVGGSNLNITGFSIISLIHGIGNDGRLTAENVEKYPFILMFIYIGILVVSAIFTIVWISRDYQANKNPKIWYKLLILIVSDTVMMFALSQMINLHWLYISIAEIKKLDFSLRSWVFILGFLSFSLGLSMWVYAGFLLGPYNSICKSFMKMTNISYKYARILMDILILLPGVILIFFFNTSWETKANYFTTYFNYGTIAFIIIAGPLAHLFLEKAWKKIPISKKNKIQEDYLLV